MNLEETVNGVADQNGKRICYGNAILNMDLGKYITY